MASTIAGPVRVPIPTLLVSLLLAASLLLAGCSGGSTSNTSVTGTVGVSSGVTLSTDGSSTSLLPTKTLTIIASVSGDTSAAGVTWTLLGEGTLTPQSSTTALYTAPASVTGTSMPVITATSVADTTKSASVTLEVLGTPVLSAVELFPAYVDVDYTARIVVAGGESSYTWTVDSGTLPDGLSLSSSTSSQVVVSGTPKTEGTYPVTLKVVDAQSRSATVDLTFVVNATVTCLLDGRYAVLYNGFRSGKPATRVASLSIDSTGAVTGVQDFKASSSVATNQAVSGTCEVSKTNAGEFKLQADNGNFNLSHAVSTDFTHGALQLISGSSSTTGTGAFYAQDASAFTIASLAGDWAFGLLGAENTDTHIGLAGRFTVDASGVISAGSVDRNGGTPLTAATGTGSMTAPDTNGRGTITLSAGSETLNLVYYVVSTDRLIVMNGDTSDNAASLSGAMTRQSGSFSTTSLDTTAVVSLWGAHGSQEPRGAAALGRLSDATGGALSAVLDETGQGTSTLGNIYTGAYAVDTSGRAALTLSKSSGTRTFAIYLDGTSNGYVVEHDSIDGNAGFLEAQVGTTFANTLFGQFISNTRYPVVPGPLSLLPAVSIANGVLSANYASGYFYLNADTGRGLGSLTTTSIGTDSIAFYEISDSHVRVLKFGTTSTRNPMIDWLDR